MTGAPGDQGRSLGLLNTMRLGLFQGCLGCLAVIFAGLLNRIMLSELAFPGLLVGGALASVLVPRIAALDRAVGERLVTQVALLSLVLGLVLAVGLMGPWTTALLMRGPGLMRLTLMFSLLRENGGDLSRG